MDITVLFKACVKTIKTRNRAFGESTAEIDKIKILSPRHRKCEFTTRSREIIQQITRLGEFLSEHRKAYLNFSNHLSHLPEMSDFERDKIDAGAQRIINACSNFINELEKGTGSEETGQKSEHRRIAIQLMKDYLKQICKMYSEQKAIRVQRSIEIKKMSRINSNSPKKTNANHGENEKQSQSQNGTNAINSINSINSINAINGANGCPGEEAREPFPESAEPLSPEELQIFELENNQLYNELNCLVDEVNQIQSEVVKIAELQEIFTEKVLEQDKDIDRIATTIIGTTENVKDANEQIRQAIQRNAGLRVWILFFLLVISFSLLFLDWYND